MSTCSNCKKNLSCGCQKRNASNGTQVCTNCLNSFENQLKQNTLNNNVNQESDNIHKRASQK